MSHIIVACKNCGTEYEWPDIFQGRVPSMDNCAICQGKKVWKTQRGGNSPIEMTYNLVSNMPMGSYSDLVIDCHLVEKQVALVAQNTGVIVCKNWKKCKFHYQGGTRPCAIQPLEALLKRAKGKAAMAKFVGNLKHYPKDST